LGVVPPERTSAARASANEVDVTAWRLAHYVLKA
jgi:hypothetical protein